MDFKKKRLNKALEDKVYKVKLVHSKKGWLTVGLTFVTLFSATALAQKTVDASAVNNVATANSTTSSSVQLWNSVTKDSIHKANRGLQNGTDWKTAKAVKGVDGETYLLVGGNEYANAKEMDLADETSKQSLTGVVHVGNVQYAQLYSDPLSGAKLITNRALSGNSDWKTDTKVVVNGITYYRVSTNEWVKGSNANLTLENSRSEKTYIKNAPDEETTTTTPDTDTNNGGSGSNSGNSGSHNGGGSTTTDNATITIHYVDSDGKTISADSTPKAKVGSEYDAYAKEIDGYTVGTLHQTIKVNKGNNEITFTYLTDEQAVDYRIITILYNDDKGVGVHGFETVRAKIGEPYTVKALDINGYTIKGDASQTINVSGTENNVVTFTYTENITKKDVTVNYVNEKGTPITTAKVLPGQEIGSTVSEDAPEITGFTLDDDKTKSVTVTKDGDNSITFKYKTNDTTPVTDKADVTVNYVDEAGQTIKASKTLTDQKVGSTVSEDAPEIDDFTLNDDKTKSVTVDKDSANNVITFTYKAKDTTPAEDTANVTVHYQDESGKTLHADSTTSEKVGSTKTITAEKIEGYTVKGESAKDVTVDKAGNEVTFTYTKNADPEVTKSEITVNYVDEDGKVLDSTKESIENGTSYTAKAKELDGYTLKGSDTQTIDSVSGNKVLTFTYTKNAEPVQQSTITTKYVDESGKDIATAKSEKVDNGTAYKAEAVKVSDYTLKGADTQTIDSVSGDKVLTFTYTTDAPQATVDTSAVASKVIELVNAYRQQNGLKALNVDSNLSAGSVSRATTVSKVVNASGNIDDSSHDGFADEPHLQQYGSTNMAENLAVTNGADVDTIAQNAMNQWKNSPDHNRALLDSSLTDIGVSVVQLDNGQFLLLQDFGGNAQNGVDWNADQFNTTTADQFGLTAEDIANQAPQNDITLTGNYYVSDHIFKTKGDYDSFIASSFDNPDPLEGSIWDSVGGSNGINGSFQVYDKQGNAVGWGLFSNNMDEPIDSYTSQGISTWIK
ncbi:MucBP domain-containing protein [Companilactobacillus insicii]|uniref:MucBP domain-containing protein n=1 Tax=Companilactobacillus insicii TaxID=1732567 RepID=UPI000F788E72|nr:MucBP domain-containing protein [Companilactobacillus insicii]